MAPHRNQSKPFVLLTGATGLLGSVILKELLTQGRRVICVIRTDSPDNARRKLVTALEVWGCAAENFLELGQLVAIRGDLCQPRLGIATEAAQRLGEMVGSIIHAAGSTAFSTQSDASLVRTNVDGTRHVFDLAAACGCKDWHLFSTAYVCGGCDRAEEVLLESRPAFRNEYEESKWTAEQESQSAAAQCGASLTTYRPSVIVGHSQTGTIPRFAGIYRVFRAVSLLARAAEQRGDCDRHNIPLRIPASESARPNLVFVDDVARDFMDLFCRPSARGGIFHLTHPDPPSNEEIQRALEQYYDISGGKFIGACSPIPKSQRTAYEDLFFDIVLDTEPYILESPVFDRTQADRLISRSPTPWNGTRLRSQIRFAESTGWRRPTCDTREVAGGDGAYSAYFEQFLPESHRRFRLSEFPDLNLDVRYVIGRSKGGDWFCRFRHGRLLAVSRTNGVGADVTYRTTPSEFWGIVRGQSSAAASFLSGSVQIEGNIERALKFAAILQEFVQEFPYRHSVDGRNGD